MLHVAYCKGVNAELARETGQRDQKHPADALRRFMRRVEAWSYGSMDQASQKKLLQTGMTSRTREIARAAG